MVITISMNFDFYEATGLQQYIITKMESSNEIFHCTTIYQHFHETDTNIVGILKTNRKVKPHEITKSLMVASVSSSQKQTFRFKHNKCPVFRRHNCNFNLVLFITLHYIVDVYYEILIEVLSSPFVLSIARERPDITYVYCAHTLYVSQTHSLIDGQSNIIYLLNAI